MAERTEERTRETEATADSAATEVDTGVDVGRLDGLRTDTAEEETESGGSYFSLRALLVAFVAVGGGIAVGSLVPILPFVALLGVPAGAFVHGLVAGQQRYIESALAGGVCAGLVAVSSFLSQFVLRGVAGGDLGMGRLFAVAAAVGLVLALVGHYFGRDLRDGLTRDIE
ncbi:hypothetical protein KTS45_13140 [Halomicroarcula limicola]|uniref:DUF456 domain-containing protein n=1 Tax=Haloarcula limicola TaxID=1429915 RepID=A0A8J7YAZ3_9EURY|nr:hypothetical protein [Halomicroarcula limicola]MBV0925143.1 hypothetical protein [Halomicroarcula limicola]